MAENFIAVVPEIGRQRFRKNLDSVTITNPAEIRPAAEAVHKISESYGFRIAVSADISSKAHLVDADGNLINKDVFGHPPGAQFSPAARLSLRERTNLVQRRRLSRTLVE